MWLIWTPGKVALSVMCATVIFFMFLSSLCVGFERSNQYKK